MIQESRFSASQARLKSELVDRGIVDCDSSWTPLAGGRTNWIWRIGEDPGALVCKLYDATAESPLFPNDPQAEFRALQALSGTGLAPEPVGLYLCHDGVCLIYHHVSGAAFDGPPDQVARALARLHQVPPPATLRQLGSGVDAIRQLGHSILDACQSTEAERLRRACPMQGHEELSFSPVFLHADIVPANVIDCGGSLTFIDWQCPAIGDPVEDLAVYLSPAMRRLYGGSFLSRTQEAEFLSTYGDADVSERFLRCRPLFHWRMAAHCLWKSERGASEYEPAMRLELDWLEQA